MNVTPELMVELTKKLTYRLEINKGGNPRFNTVEYIRHYSIPSKGVLAIPQGRQDLIPEDYEIKDKRTMIEAVLPYPKLDLYAPQQIVLDNWEDSGMLNALVGWGKTYTALWIAFKLGQKTLIVTHNTMLRDQWANDVKVLFGINPGIVGSGEYDIDSPIVISNVQTLTKHAARLSDAFGTLILDESHHCPASTFANIISNSKARYRVGLSGTMERKDGKHIIFKDLFGPILHKPPQSNTLNPLIKIIKSGRKLMGGTDWVKKINNLMEDRDYMEFVVALAKVQMAKGHKVLVIADRVNFLTTVNRLIGDESVLITGETADYATREKSKLQIDSGEKKCICGSRQIFSEGISINPLSCLILTCPISSEILLEQLIGRVMRNSPGKLDPVVLDINFQDNKLNSTRQIFYYSKGWKIEELSS